MSRMDRGLGGTGASRSALAELRKAQHDMGAELLRFAHLVDNIETQMMDARDSLARLKLHHKAAGLLTEAVSIELEQDHG